METVCIRCDGTGEIAIKFSFATQLWTKEACPDCTGTGFLTEAPAVMPVYVENYCRYVHYRKVP